MGLIEATHSPCNREEVATPSAQLGEAQRQTGKWGDLDNEQKEGAKQDPVKTIRAGKLEDEWLSEGHQNAVRLCLSLLGLVESQRERESS